MALISGILRRFCGDNPAANSFVVVESANPKNRALIEAELDLQQRPEFDKSTVVTPHLIGPTHLAKGDVVVVNGQATVKYRIEDLNGKVIASSSSTGPLQNLLEQLDAAGRDLREKLCKPANQQTNQWTGAIIYKLDDSHESTTESKSASTVTTTTTTSNKHTIRIHNQRSIGLAIF